MPLSLGCHVSFLSCLLISSLPFSPLFSSLLLSPLFSSSSHSTFLLFPLPSSLLSSAQFSPLLQLWSIYLVDWHRSEDLRAVGAWRSLLFTDRLATCSRSRAPDAPCLAGVAPARESLLFQSSIFLSKLLSLCGTAATCGLIVKSLLVLWRQTNC